MNELAKRPNTTPMVIERDTVVKYLKMLGFKFSDSAAEKFAEIALAYQLNPFKKEIHGVENFDKRNPSDGITIMVGYEVYLKRAEATGMLDGWEKSVEFDKNDNPLLANIIIYRKDWAHPFKHTVYFKEVAKRKKDGAYSATWASQPIFMVQKVCIAQGFRLCFPDQMAGLPYTKEEQESFKQEALPEPVTPIEIEQDIPLEPDAIPATKPKTLTELRQLFMEANDVKELKSLMKDFTEDVKLLSKEHQKEISEFCKNYKVTLTSPPADDEPSF